MSEDKKSNNILNLGKKEEKIKEKINDADKELQNQPDPKKLYHVTLIFADMEKRHIKIIVDVTPTTIIMAKNKEAIFLFSQVQEFPEYTVYIYQEVSSLLLDVQTPMEDISHEPK